MINDEFKENIRHIFNSHYLSFEENFFKDYELDGDKRYNIEEKDNNITYLGIDNRIKYYSTILRSYDSSIGNLYEKIMSSLAESRGFISHHSINSCILTNREKGFISSFDTNTKITDFDYSILDTFNIENKVITFDLLLEKEINGKAIYNVFEIKTGGDLDNKKAKSEKRALFEKCIYLYKYLENDNNISEFEIKPYFATIYNKNLIDGTNDDWIQERVREHFDNEELLIGKEFFNFVCDTDDEDLWEQIKLNVTNVNQTISSRIDDLITTIEQEKIILGRFNTFGAQHLPTEIFLHSCLINIKEENRVLHTNCYFIHNKENIFSVYVGDENFDTFFDIEAIRNSVCTFEGIVGYGDLFDRLNSFSFKKSFLLVNLDKFLKNKNKEISIRENRLYKREVIRILDSNNQISEYNNLNPIKQEFFLEKFVSKIGNGNANETNYEVSEHIIDFIEYCKNEKFRSKEIAFVKLVKKGRIEI